jgi:hypothetical protein
MVDWWKLVILDAKTTCNVYTHKMVDTTTTSPYYMNIILSDNSHQCPLRPFSVTAGIAALAAF